MTYDAGRKRREIVRIAILTVVYIALQIMIPNMGRFGMSAFNGVIMAFQYGLCLIMAQVAGKTGLKTALVLQGISFIIIIMGFVRSHNMTMLPGIVNTVFYVTTLVLLGVFFSKREKENLTDVITGALNRRGLFNNLMARMDSKKSYSVIYLTLDNYKAIIDTYGHAYGDELMQKMIRRMEKKLGKAGTIARVGVELVVEKTANMLLDVIREKAVLVVNDNRVDCYMTCYAGAASYPEDADNYEDLLKYADIAMYRAISDKAKTAYVFDKSMAEFMNRQIEVEHLIKEGLRKQYFYLVYQPQFMLEGKKLRGFETLIRMKTPDGTMVSPGEFIPVAEKSDLIFQIDDYVLRRAMIEFKEIVEKDNDIVVSINISAKNICDASFVGKLKSILEKTGYPAKNLEIEITEYCMVNSMDITIRNIEILRDMGVQIALDDFGTGYTSLSYVSSLPINLLKVDKSLIDDMETDRKRQEFVHAVVAMGHLMGCEVISEGVENDDQLKILRDNGCDFVQGYVWGRPLDYDVARELVNK